MPYSFTLFHFVHLNLKRKTQRIAVNKINNGTIIITIRIMIRMTLVILLSSMVPPFFNACSSAPLLTTRKNTTIATTITQIIATSIGHYNTEV